jgi:tRNA uridine 5-carboxymethylaminomethyl modification enzyme
VKKILGELGTAEISKPFTLAELLRRPEIAYDDLAQLTPPLDDLLAEAKDQATIQIKYEGYIRREWAQVKHLRQLESRKIPPDFDYEDVRGITMEAREKLLKIRPYSLGQASRISGVSPADISVLLVMLSQKGRNREHPETSGGS